MRSRIAILLSEPNILFSPFGDGDGSLVGLQFSSSIRESYLVGSYLALDGELLVLSRVIVFNASKSFSANSAGFSVGYGSP